MQVLPEAISSRSVGISATVRRPSAKCIGEDTGSPIDYSYTSPFEFNGRLDKVTVKLKPETGAGGRALH